MKGEILDYNLQDAVGVILADDGQRYNFVNTEWKSTLINPSQGIEVDFETQDRNATAIYALAALQEQEVSSSQMNPWQYYVTALKNYAKFDGRTTQGGFWYFHLISFVISFVLSLISAGALGVLYALGVLVPSLAIGARRLHDTGKSGWWQLLLVIPLIGIIVLIIFWAQSPQEEKNQFDIN